VTRGWDPPPRIIGYADPRRRQGLDDSYCSVERYALAEKDFTVWFSKIKDAARRANVAFYSLYAHPLITFKQAGPDIDEQTRQFERRWGNLQESNANLTARVAGEFAAIDEDKRLWHDNLTDLSKDTNGRAILKKDDFDSGLQQIAESLSSYYLLGYYSTNTKRDGAYRKISVSVKRKGVAVRARQGYRAIPPPEIAAAAADRREPVAPVVNSALSALARFRNDVPFHLAATSEWGQTTGWRLRVVGELEVEEAGKPGWKPGWRSELSIVAPDGKPLGAAGVSVKPGEARFAVSYPTSGGLPPGEYAVKGKAFASDGETVFEDRAIVVVPPAPSPAADMTTGTPLLFRRPNTPKSVFQPTADQRFRRREILMVEVPVVGRLETAPVLRLIDRQGQARDAGLQPTTEQRDGIVIITVAIPLSSVAPGDYVLEFSTSADAARPKVYVGFRVVP
jgi:hypothetical protein